MSWVNKRIKQYQEGQEATCLEKIALEHGHPVNFTANMIGLVVLGYGLWMHDCALITAGIAIAFLGHIYCWMKK